MNVTYEVDAKNDKWSDLFTFNIINKDFEKNPYKHYKKPHKHHHHCPCKPGHKHHHCPCDGEGNKGCNCDPKKTQKEIEKVRKEVLKEVIKLIDEQADLDINKIVNAVIKKQKPHEDNQTSNINKNQQDINDLNNITIWDKDNHFNG